MNTLRVTVTVNAGLAPGQWPAAKAWDWYDAQPWLVGCNFTPSTAINQLEFWQEETFDPPTIRRELAWARDFGMNTLRVYLHDVAYQTDPAGFLNRIDRFLDEAKSCGIRPMLTLFDDCWHPDAKPGKQPEPVPGVHNSGWLQSPGHTQVNDPLQWQRLEDYVKSVIHEYRADPRVLAWDLYNEPGNGGQGKKSQPLLRKVFEWAREIGPEQPLTAAAWGADAEMDALMMALSDVASFHHYESLDKASELLPGWQACGRPLVCSEWLARTNQSVAEFLPWFREHRIGCMNWGFVAGKIQTNYPWGSPAGAPEPNPWFHDLVRPDGAPYDPEEFETFRRETSLVRRQLAN